MNLFPVPSIISTKEKIMKNSKLTLSSLFTGALLLGAPSLMAGEGHDHSNHEGHGHHDAPPADSSKPESIVSSHDGMTALYGHLGEISASLKAGKVEGVHDHAEAIGPSLKDLDKDTSLTAAKKKRVQGYVKNVLKLADKIHVSADGKNIVQAKKDFVKLQAQVDLLDKQFAHSHKPGTAENPKAADGHPETKEMKP
jgi:hypothetical protein